MEPGSRESGSSIPDTSSSSSSTRQTHDKTSQSKRENIKGLRWVSLFMWTHLRATECHLPYGITQRYLPPNTGERLNIVTQARQVVLNLPTAEEWKSTEVPQNQLILNSVVNLDGVDTLEHYSVMYLSDLCMASIISKCIFVKSNLLTFWRCPHLHKISSKSVYMYRRTDMIRMQPRYTGWPLSRHSEIPWHFPDNVRHSWPC